MHELKNCFFSVFGIELNDFEAPVCSFEWRKFWNKNWLDISIEK